MTTSRMNINETYLKCPAWIGPDCNWLCDSKAEYAISGTILCHHHALGVNGGGPWRTWLDNLQSARKEEAKEVQVNETSTNSI